RVAARARAHVGPHRGVAGEYRAHRPQTRPRPRQGRARSGGKGNNARRGRSRAKSEKDVASGFSPTPEVDMKRLLVLAFLALAAPVAAQAPAQAPPKTPSKPASSAPRAFTQTRQPGDVEVDPIKCFWKTDRSTVIVGERFTVVLTCGIVETD